MATPLAQAITASRFGQPTPVSQSYDSSGINPGGGMVNSMRMMPDAPDFGGGGGAPLPSQPPATTPPVTPPPVTTPAGPSTPVAAPPPDLSPTAANPLAPLNSYQAQQATGSYQAPAFQGSSSYQAGSYQAPQIDAPQAQGYQAQSYNAPQAQAPNYQAGNASAQQVGSQNATAGQFDVSAFRPFADAVYSEATRQLDPQMASQEAAFRQRMVNQGIQEGTPAFDAAYANFERSRNDAYSQARNQSLAQALGAQNQFFGQNLANSQMGLQASLANASNGLQAQGLNQADRQFGANLGQQTALANMQSALQAMGLNQADRQFGANLGLQGQQMGLQAALANAQMGMQAQQMGQQDRQFGAQMGLSYDQLANAFNQQNAQFGSNLGLQYAQLGQADRQFGANYDFQQGQADIQTLMALLGYGNQMDQYNNQWLGTDQQRAGSLFGLIPGLAPTQLDVQGTINTGASINQSNAANAQSGQNAMYQAVGQMAGAAMGMSDRRVKTDIARVGTLDNGLPVYVYRFKHGGPPQIGVMAQDVEQVKPHAVAEIGGIKHVNYAEAVQ